MVFVVDVGVVLCRPLLLLAYLPLLISGDFCS